MRKDLESLLRPLELAKQARRRAAVRSRYALGSIVLLFVTAFLIVDEVRQPAAAALLLVIGLATIGFQHSRLARMSDAVPPEWLILAVECRLSRTGRQALTALLLAGKPSCDDALAWGRAERERLPDDLREAAICSEHSRS